MTGQPAVPLPTLDYPALRLRWCRLALLVFLRRWGMYGLVAVALIGAGSNSPLDSVGAVAAWLVLPLFQAAARPGWAGLWLVPLAAVQALLAGGLVWAMRPLLWPAHWAVAERVLPIPPALQRRSDLTVVTLALIPLLVLYGLGAATWLANRPDWLMPWRERAVLGLVLLDEPLNALDAASLAHLRMALQHAHAQRRQAWLVASHEPPLPATADMALLDLAAPTPAAPDHTLG